MKPIPRDAFAPYPGLRPRLDAVLSVAAPLDAAICFGVGLAAQGVLAVKSRLDRTVYLRHARETAAKNATPSPTDVANA